MIRSCVLIAVLLPWIAMGNPQSVRFLTDDSVTIRADWYPSPNSPAPVLVLLHMNRKDRTTWSEFAQKAEDSGFSVLAIDFRGHGESTMKMLTEINAATFSNSDYEKFILDVKSAVEWVKTSALPKPTAISLVGASVGANVALKYAAADSLIAAIVAISPGLDYRNILAEPALIQLGLRPCLLIAAEDDNYAFVSSKSMLSTAGAGTKGEFFESGGHGTYLFESRPEVSDSILTFLRDYGK